MKSSSHKDSISIALNSEEIAFINDQLEDYLKEKDFEFKYKEHKQTNHQIKKFVLGNNNLTKKRSTMQAFGR